ncbi:hypothetical protein B9Z55_022491 [Caenorhabditis nigoni]|uniref:Uncharacterized protein n=1 Tax=Caenorhabditis nigoni TaxID=1611254 RepID=A0A2G5SKV4_9PELO|nr:hypothetical protein B9Z55_022491 [Caenorhabditis nigoni]
MGSPSKTHCQAVHRSSDKVVQQTVARMTVNTNLDQCPPGQAVHRSSDKVVQQTVARMTIDTNLDQCPPGPPHKHHRTVSSA